MPRAIWKGAVTFGLVHVPVSLYPASEDRGIDFDWLDKRSMDPVGYKRINKRTGKEIAAENIVKGIKQEGGDYVVLSEKQIAAAYPKATQTIEIECFVQASDIALAMLDRPYFLEPVGKADRVYALLREAMLAAGVVGIARVVMHTKEHLAALMPSGKALMLNTLRWADELRDVADLKLPAAGAATAKLKPAELKMAAQLIKDMTEPWKPDGFKNEFATAVHKLVAQKVKAGDTETVTAIDAEPSEKPDGKVADLAALLSQSLNRGKRASTATTTGRASRRSSHARRASRAR